MPVRNSGPFLGDALRSVATQTVEDWQLVLVLDGPPSDEEARVLAESRDSRFTVVALPSVVGVASALNAGLEHCRAALVARLDADDLAYPHRLERQTSAFDTDPDLALLGSAATTIDRAGMRTGSITVKTGRPSVSRALLTRNQFIHPSVMFRRKAVESLGGYDARCVRVEDYELWLRMAARFALDNLDEQLIQYRKHSAQHSEGTTLEPYGIRAIRDARYAVAHKLGVPRGAAVVSHYLWFAAQYRRSMSRTLERAMGRR